MSSFHTFLHTNPFGGIYQAAHHSSPGRLPNVCQLVISLSPGDEAPSDEEELSEGEL